MLKRLIFWEYPRASWQYDVIVGVILAFIFLTPREWFRDQPNPSSIALVSSGNGVSSYFVEASSLSWTPQLQRPAKVAELLRVHTSDRRLTVTRLEPVRNSEGELQGYVAFTRH